MTVIERTKLRPLVSIVRSLGVLLAQVGERFVRAKSMVRTIAGST